MVDNLQLRIKKSLHHVEVNLSEAKGYEKHVIVDLFKETYGKTINSSLPCSPENCQGTLLDLCTNAKGMDQSIKLVINMLKSLSESDHSVRGREVILRVLVVY